MNEAVGRLETPPLLAFIGAGSNLGDRAANLNFARESLAQADGVRVLRESSRRRTLPVGGPPQESFLNSVIEVETTFSSVELLRLLHQIEDARGRTRDLRWGPRTLDLDLLVHGAEIRWESPVLPHPELARRSFVLDPWCELAPQLRVPGVDRTVLELAQAVARPGKGGAVCITVKVDPPGKCKVRTPAKVNLWLHVTGKRDDGFHELDSLMVALDLWDEIELERNESGDVTIEVTEGDVPATKDNLCVRAARAFLDSRGSSGGVAIRLRKRIPVGAGLGGGSGNAAGVLLGLAALETSPPTGDELLALAGELGSDVPFFLAGGTIRCRGRGERVSRMSHTLETQGILVFPGVSLATATVYKSFNFDRNPAVNCDILPLYLNRSWVWVGRGSFEPSDPRSDFDRPRSGKSIAGSLPVEQFPMGWPCNAATDSGPIAIELRNDLEEAAMTASDRLARAREELVALGMPRLLLCGSGSTFYIPFEDAGEIAPALAVLRDAGFVQTWSVSSTFHG